MKLKTLSHLKSFMTIEEIITDMWYYTPSLFYELVKKSYNKNYKIPEKEYNILKKTEFIKKNNITPNIKKFILNKVIFNGNVKEIEIKIA